MLKNSLALSIACTLILTLTIPVAATSRSAAEKQNQFIEKVKAGISKLGVGPEAQVQVKLRNKTKLSGFISEANETSFVVTDKNGAKTVVAYPDVTQVKGNNLSKGAKILIIGGIVAGVLAIIYFAAFAGKHL
jgi:hypothetical protein